MRTVIILSSIILMCLFSGCSDSDNGTAPATALDTPAGLSVTDTGLASLTLSWDASDRATEYNLYRSESASGILHLIYPGALMEFTDYNRTCGTTYYYQVSAENSTGESDRSAAVNGTTGIPSGTRSRDRRPDTWTIPLTISMRSTASPIMCLTLWA